LPGNGPRNSGSSRLQSIDETVKLVALKNLLAMQEKYCAV